MNIFKKFLNKNKDDNNKESNVSANNTINNGDVEQNIKPAKKQSNVVSKKKKEKVVIDRAKQKKEYKKIKQEKQEKALEKRKVLEEQKQKELNEIISKKEKEMIEAKRKREEEFKERKNQQAVKIETKQYKEEKEEEFDLFGYKIQDVYQGKVVNVQIINDEGDLFICNVEDSFQEILVPKNEMYDLPQKNDIFEVLIYRHTNDDFYGSQRRLMNKNKISEIKELKEQKEKLNGEIIDIDGNDFVVKLDNELRATIYKNNLQLDYIEDMDKFVGTKMDFLVKKTNPRGKYPFELTRIPLLIEQLESNLSEVEVGKIITVGEFERIKGGIVFEYKGFKVFVPNSELSYKFIDENTNLNEIITVGMDAQVIELKRKKYGYDVVASIKKQLDDPFETYTAKVEVGTKIQGKIARKENYGLFIELDNQIKGLLHQNDYSNEISANIKDLKIGDIVEAEIKEIDINKKHINLKN